MKINRRGICKFIGVQFPRLVGLMTAGIFLATGFAYAGGGHNLHPFPNKNDPSAFTGPVIGDLPEGLPEANEGAFEGGNTGTGNDASDNNSLGEDQQLADGEYNIPTNGPPSPLFSAAPFSQQMLRFEEFGPQRLLGKGRGLGHRGAQQVKGRPGIAQHAIGQGGLGPQKLRVANFPFPAPPNAQSSPSGADLDDFLSQGIFPLPTRFANIGVANPWQAEIEAFLGRGLNHPPAEGRPPGEGWSHQRWDEFSPEIYFQTATAEARTNGGLRDAKQDHGYSEGEFGPGGLYYNTVGAPGFEGTTAGISVKFHPNFPVQVDNALWTFDGTFPPKLLQVRYGEPVLMRHYNALPIDVAANRGFGLHTITTHEHNGHNPAESDGYTNAFFFPGQFYDYRWPMALAGHDSINQDASDPRAGSPDGHGGIRKIPGNWQETMSTHWFHDHMLDFTAQNVYKGNAAMMNYYSALDRGNERIEDGVNLRLPSGTALDWGNRDYDVNLLLADKAWDSEGQLWFNPFNINGFLGDVMTVNWLYKPYLEVRARRYRFRILNGSVSRYFKVALVNQGGDPVPFHMVANDGNIMEHAVFFENGELPTQGIAERYDIVVDFSAFEEGDTLYFVNMLAHKNGQVTDKPISLADIQSGAYHPEQVDEDQDGVPDSWVGGDPTVGRFLEVRVKQYAEIDLSMNPADYVAGKLQMIPLPEITDEELANAVHRTFEFEKNPTDEKPWVIESDGGKGLPMDPRRVTAAPQKNSGGLEVWRLVNGGDWSHPIHIHFEEGRILRRGGKEPPEWEKWARKDVYRIGPQEDSGAIVEVALRFRDFAGTYMEHCHNTQHEDHAMLMRWDIEHPGQVKLMPTPIPSWDGVSYVDSAALPTFRSGDGVGEFGPPLDPMEVWLDDVTIGDLDLVNTEIGDALNPTEDERGTATYSLLKGINNDDGVETEIYFVLHDISNEALADQLGIVYSGGLKTTPEAASSEAAMSEDGQWTFFGDLPNPVATTDSPPVDDNNTYSPLRRVMIDGQDVIVNAFFVKWGDEAWERMRIDESCVLPDSPPNTSCMYLGTEVGDPENSGQALEINTDVAEPYVTLKLHKSWHSVEYIPYYVVVDTYPAGPGDAMGVPYVPKHAFLGTSAVPLMQYLPPEPLNETFPESPSDGFGLPGGGPLGGQIGNPSYFMPGDDLNPMWHIGYAHWLEPATEVVKSLERAQELRAEGKLELIEFPASAVGGDSYDFENPNPVHVVNCPVPMTLDVAIHRATR